MREKEIHYIFQVTNTLPYWGFPLSGSNIVVLDSESPAEEPLENFQSLGISKVHTPPPPPIPSPSPHCMHSTVYGRLLGITHQRRKMLLHPLWFSPKISDSFLMQSPWAKMLAIWNWRSLVNHSHKNLELIITAPLLTHETATGDMVPHHSGLISGTQSLQISLL